MCARHRRLVDSVPHRHHDAGVPEALLEFPERHAGLGAVYGVRVPQVVEPYIHESGRRTDLLPGLTQRVGRDGAEQRVGLPQPLLGHPTPQGVQALSAEWNASHGLHGLPSGHHDGPCLELNVLDLEGEDLAPALSFTFFYHRIVHRGSSREA